MKKQNLIYKEYTTSNYQNCLELFELNCPSFFAKEEREDYQKFLKSNNDLYLLGYKDNIFVCCFGITDQPKEICSISWIMVHPNFHHGGYGSEMISYILDYAKNKGKERILIATSQHASSFFKKYGAKQLNYIKDGWGIGMDKIDMQITL